MRKRATMFLGVTLALLLGGAGMAAAARRAAGPRPEPDRAVSASVSASASDPALASAWDAEALARAVDAAARAPDQLAGAWWDEERGRIAVGYVPGPGAKERAERLGPRVAAVPVRHSYRELDEIVRTALTLRGPGTDTLVAALPDWAHNRVVVQATEPTPGLRRLLRARYGDAVVLQRGPALRATALPAPAVANPRDQARPPLAGGARYAARDPFHVGYTLCTAGFAYRGSDGTERWLTAGHCLPQQSPRKHAFTDGLPAYSLPVGSMTGRSTFREGVGTVRYGGGMRGDLALVDLLVDAVPRLYVGGATSARTVPVRGSWGRTSVPGDRYCVGGATAGELCGWTVAATGAAYRDVRTHELIYPVTIGWKYGWCSRPGDSGGPVYTKTSAGAYAKGVHSGAGGGGSDSWGGSSDPCVSAFTEIAYARAAFGGGVLTW